MAGAEQQRVAVVAGASGMVGREIVRELLAEPRVARLVCLVRRPLEAFASETRVEQRVVDFARLTPDEIPKDAEDAYCALGTTLKAAGSREAFRKVDYDAVVAFARACRAQGVRRFLLVSSQGADERSVIFYSRVKGEVERAVREIGFDTTHLARPGMLAADRTEVRRGERLALALLRPIAAIAPRSSIAPIPVATVGRALVRIAFSAERGAQIHRSNALKAAGTY